MVMDPALRKRLKVRALKPGAVGFGVFLAVFGIFVGFLGAVVALVGVWLCGM